MLESAAITSKKWQPKLHHQDHRWWRFCLHQQPRDRTAVTDVEELQSPRLKTTRHVRSMLVVFFDSFRLYTMNLSRQTVNTCPYCAVWQKAFSANVDCGMTLQHDNSVNFLPEQQFLLPIPHIHHVWVPFFTQMKFGLCIIAVNSRFRFMVKSQMSQKQLLLIMMQCCNVLMKVTTCTCYAQNRAALLSWNSFRSWCTL